MASSPSMKTQQELHAGLHNRDFFSIPETARLFGSDDRTVRKAVAAGNIPATRLGCKWFVPTAWLREQVRPCAA
jgi:excisionase family DNA binding protein